MEKYGRPASAPEVPVEKIGGYKVLDTTVDSDGMVTRHLEDGYVNPNDPDAANNAMDRAKEQIAREKRGRRSDGRSLGLPITAMRQPARRQPSTEESS